MARVRMTGWIVRMLVVCLCPAMASAGDAGRHDPLFNSAQVARDRADAAGGELLAPASHRRGLEAFRKAEEVAAEDGRAERVRALLTEASGYFERAQEVSLRAREVLSDAIAARRDAESAGAKTPANDIWEDAEDEFRAATTRLEKNRDADVGKYRERAVTLYRQAELAAIETTLFAEAERQIGRAREKKALRDAPTGLAEAERLLLEARARLAADRYDTDQPRDNATLATHHALRAQFIAEARRRLDRREITLEGLLEPWEDELTNLAELLDLVVYYDDGPGDAGNQIGTAVTDLLLAHNRLEDQLAEQHRYAMVLQQEIETLQTELGGQSQARARLQAELERQEKMKEKVRRVEGLFEPAEAQVLRVQDRLVLRMIGVSFGSGRAVLENRHHALLGKVRKALGEFPDTPVIVEGHTDSHGADATNLELSQTRADAVMKYLLAGGTIAKELLTAVGYGETQPVASNESEEGRQKNRRIDVVLYPQW